MIDQPDPLNAAGIIDTLRTNGSTRLARSGHPVEFTDSRRRTRAAARAANLRISARRVSGVVLVQHLDHIVTEARSTPSGTSSPPTPTAQTLTWDELCAKPLGNGSHPSPR